MAIRENEQRVEFLGYDARLHKLIAFAISGGLAGLAGCLFASWGNYVSPTAFSVVQSAQIIIWMMVGGVGTLLGPVIGCFAISWLTAALGTQQVISANVALGAILLFFVLLVPRGIAPMTEAALGGKQWLARLDLLRRIGLRCGRPRGRLRSRTGVTPAALRVNADAECQD